MTQDGTRPTAVDLTNCDREPIHVPGSVQPHGALVAFAELDGAPVVVSENIGDFLDVTDLESLRLAQLIDPDETAMLAALRDGDDELQHLNPILVRTCQGDCEGVIHRHDGLLILEVERATDEPRFDLRRVQGQVQRAVSRLRQARTLNDLWRLTVETARELTGYDRVMVYRFDQDLHGEVVAEVCSDRVEGRFLGLHYPAGDVPEPARRLYLLNPLRIIVDVSYEPARLEPPHNPLTGAPLDLSHSVLRSVSPIHCEYLTNMGVRSSLSLSLIVDGRLWGLVACHHYREALHVPFSVRASCEMLTQALSWQIGTLERELRSSRTSAAAQSVARVMQRVGSASKVEEVLVETSDHLLAIPDAQGAVVAVDGTLRTVGLVPDEEQLRALIAWWVRRADEAPIENRHDTLSRTLLTTASLQRLYPAGSAFMEQACGVLAVGFPAIQGNLVMWFRPRVERTVRWGGDPHKPASWGPNGQRLSPRASFEEWCETVRDQAAPWLDYQVEAALQLRQELASVMYGRALEADKTRSLFLSILGHDLRNPLGALMTSAEVLRRAPSRPDLTSRMSERIKSSGDRMQRMIDQLLDISRIEASRGTGLPIERRSFDVRDLVLEIIKETELARPGSPMRLHAEGPCELHADPDRIGQVVANLLSNARHHGAADAPIDIELNCGPEQVTIRVVNTGEPIPEAMRQRLFEPFKALDPATAHRGPGLGLGLYITHAIVTAHDGRIVVDSDEDSTAFTVSLPRVRTLDPL